MHPINELKLLETTSSRFNIWGKLYMNWIGPILLARALSGRDPTLPPEVVHGIVLVKEKGKEDENGVQKRTFERKIKFSPFGVTSLRQDDFEGERLGYWTGKAADTFDPTYRVEKCEMPDYLLQKVLPVHILNLPPPEPKAKAAKRKAQVETNKPDESLVAAKRQRIANAATTTPLTKTSRSRVTPKGSMPSRQEHSASWIHDVIELSDSEDELRLPPSRLQSGSSARPAPSRIVDLGSPSSEEYRPNTVPRAASSRKIAQQTPSRMNQDILPRFRRDLFAGAGEEDELRIALRLSMQENVISSRRKLPTSTDLIMHTSNDPHGSFEASADSTRGHEQSAVKVTQDIMRKRSGISSRESVLHTNAYIASQQELVVSDHSPARTNLTDVPTFDDIRVARLRHFQQTPTILASMIESPGFTPQSRGTSARRTEPRVQILPGISYIDLTAD